MVTRQSATALEAFIDVDADGRLWLLHTRMHKPQPTVFVDPVAAAAGLADYACVHAVLKRNTSRLLSRLDTTRQKVFVLPPSAVGGTTTVEETINSIWYVEGARKFEVKPEDQAAYRVFSGEASRVQLIEHPAWSAVSFVCSDPDRCARLLQLIPDMRFYSALELYGQSRQLHRAFGVGYLSPIAAGDSRVDMFDSLCQLWQRGDNGQTPADFLHRIYLDAVTSEQGLLKASKKLLDFVRLVWLANRNDGFVFEPSLFFKQQDEIQAWRSHIGNFQTQHPLHVRDHDQYSESL